MKLATEKIFTHPLGIIGAAVGATALWGSAYPFIKLSYAELGIGSDDIYRQILFAGYRFFLASLLILLFMKLIGKKISYQKGTLGRVGQIGLFQTLLQYIFFYYGMSGSSGVTGAIIAGTTSFFQILLAHYMYAGDKINARKSVGLIIGFSGVVLVGISKGSLSLEFGIAEICLLLAAFFGALGNILSKKASEQLDVLYMTACQMLLGGVALLAIGAIGAGAMPFEFTASAAWMLLYLAILSALGFVLWNTVMKYNKVGSISMYLFLIPVFGVFLSAGILGEELHLFVWAALALVVGGIVIVNGTRKPSGMELPRSAKTTI
ncbi:DMT family transporter [Cohnella cholangitidis]|uniref:DMT family transporter n=1 Tax=Cohnella cholangitidis TaxID=2598458 RepID=A0A7G5C300_9BACL|nr:DMT family transporter [Cohnella cholangitidis]QMV43584.1 DMT family transporter [Cohnella cholangitidis]